jgi:hypothetical protein
MNKFDFEGCKWLLNSLSDQGHIGGKFFIGFNYSFSNQGQAAHYYKQVVDSCQSYWIHQLLFLQDDEDWNISLPFKIPNIQLDNENDYKLFSAGISRRNGNGDECLGKQVEMLKLGYFMDNIFQEMQKKFSEMESVVLGEYDEDFNKRIRKLER